MDQNTKNTDAATGPGPGPGESNARAVRNPDKPAQPAKGSGPVQTQGTAAAAATAAGHAPSMTRVTMLRDHEGHAAGAELQLPHDQAQSWVTAGAAKAHEG